MNLRFQVCSLPHLAQEQLDLLHKIQKRQCSKLYLESLLLPVRHDQSVVFLRKDILQAVEFESIEVHTHVLQGTGTHAEANIGTICVHSSDSVFIGLEPEVVWLRF